MGDNARLQFLLEIYRACLTFFYKNSKSKKGHNCAKHILRVTSPIGMSYSFHNEQLVEFQVNIFSNDRDITKCPSFCTTTTTQEL